MTEQWLTCIGIGEDGLHGLSAVARMEVEKSKVIFGGERHLNFLKSVNAEKIPWDSPLENSLRQLDKYRGQAVTVLATGNPMWFGIGSTILKRYRNEEVRFFPVPSSFSLGAARMGWSLDKTICQSAHGRQLEGIRKFFFPNTRMLLLAHDGNTPSKVAKMLCEDDYGSSKLTALIHMGGELEEVVHERADKWTNMVPDFHLLAIELIPEGEIEFRSCCPGLPDILFENDGNITKRDIRSATLAKLVPLPEQHLWDVGAGCGSVGIEWMRVAKHAHTTAIESKEKRRELIKKNASRLGVPELDVVGESAPECLINLELPDAIFIGGGLTKANLVEQCVDYLKQSGRLVANAVTIEGEKILLEAVDRFGGELIRLSISHVAPFGGFSGWKPAMPVTQWSLIKK